MWLVPQGVSGSCRCVPASEGSTSEWLERYPEAGLSVISSGKATLRPYSWRGWKNRPWSRHLFGAATWGTSMRSRGLESWIASLRDTPASHSAPQGSGKVSAILATYGLKSHESSASADHPSFFSRTSPAIYPSDSMSSAESFKAWATGLRRAYSARRKSERPIAESGSFAWHSPVASDSDGRPRWDHRASPGHVRNKPVPNVTAQALEMWKAPTANEDAAGRPGANMQQMLKQQSESFQHGLHDRPTEQDGSESSPNTRGSRLPSAWPTPTEDNANNSAGPSRVRGAELGGYQNLTVAANGWGTPRPSMTKNSTMIDKGDSSNIEEQVGRVSSGPSKRLNPLFVEWLMGYPLGWTVTQEADAWEATCQDRMDRLRCLGNAVVPATAQKAFVTLAGELNAGA